MTIKKTLGGIWIGLSLCVTSAAGQVTGSGTAGTVPVFTGSSAVGNSTISISGSNVGIGTQTPVYSLDTGLGAKTWSSWNSFSAPAIASNIYTGPGIQKVNARASLYAAIAARNPGTSFSLYVIPWDGVNTLEGNCNSQLNSYWNAQAAVKGNYFYQTFDDTDFSQYSTVLTNQSDFDNNKSSGTQWWIGCSTLPSYSVGNVLVPSSSNIFDIGGGSNPGVGLDVQGYGAYVGNGIYATIVGSNTTGGCDGCGYFGGYFTAVGTSDGYPSSNVGLYASASGSSAYNFAAIFDQGNVGIGSTFPVGAKLQVSSNGSSSPAPPLLGHTNSSVALDLTNQDQGSGLLAGVLPSGSAFLQAQRTDGTATAYNVSINPNGGNVGIGTTTPGLDLAGLPTPPVSGTPIFEVKGDIALAQGSGGKIFFSDASVQSTAWNGVLNGGDYAEDMRATGNKAKYEPGDVLVLAEGENADVQKSAQPYSTMVAGIYATKPGVVGLRDAVKNSADNVPMAMVGVVPTKVSAENGPIRKGDLLVTASLPGYAMKGTDHSRMLGAVLGKAMGSLDSGTGVIEVLVTLQ